MPLKLKRKYFGARWASTSYLEKHESRPVVTGSEVCTSQMSTDDCLRTAFPCVCRLNCTFKLYSDTVCYKYIASDHLCTTHIHSSTVQYDCSEQLNMSCVLVGSPSFQGILRTL